MFSPSLALRHRRGIDRLVDARRRTFGRLADHGVRGSTRDRSAQPVNEASRLKQPKHVPEALTTVQTAQIREDARTWRGGRLARATPRWSDPGPG
jgi:hypothetical protein